MLIPDKTDFCSMLIVHGNVLDLEKVWKGNLNVVGIVQKHPWIRLCPWKCLKHASPLYKKKLVTTFMSCNLTTLQRMQLNFCAELVFSCRRLFLLYAEQSQSPGFTQWISCTKAHLKQKPSIVVAYLHCFPSPRCEFCRALTVYSPFDCASICRSHETRNCSSIHFVNSLLKRKHLCRTIN